MNTSCPRHAIVSLIQLGWSEARIATVCGSSQSTIHRVKSGRQKSVSFELGTAVISLAREQGIDVTGPAPAMLPATRPR